MISQVCYRVPDTVATLHKLTRQFKNRKLTHDQLWVKINNLFPNYVNGPCIRIIWMNGEPAIDHSDHYVAVAH